MVLLYIVTYFKQRNSLTTPEENHIKRKELQNSKSINQMIFNRFILYYLRGNVYRYIYI